MAPKTSIGIAPGNRHPFTDTIINLFRTTKPGDVLTYEAIAAKVGAARDRWRMDTVIKALADEYRISIETVRKVGYRHVPDADVGGSASVMRGGVRRKLRRIGRHLACVKSYDALTPQQQRDLNTERAITGTLEFLLARPQVKAISEHVEVTNSKIDVGNVMALLKP